MGNTTIDINGKRYDAQSGALLGEGAKPTAASIRKVARQGRAVDGFMHPHKMNTSVNQITKQQVDAKIAAKQAQLAALKAKRAAALKYAKTVTAHKPEPAKTLMRHAVKKPVITPKKSLKIQAPQEMAIAQKPGTAAPSHKLAAHTVDRRRLTRARSTQQSNHIQRFSTAQQNHPVAAKPVAPVVNTVAVAQPAGQQVRVNTQYAATPVKRQVNSVQHRPRQSDIRRVQGGQQVKKAAPHADIFEAAIANARSHEQPAHKPRRSAGRRLLQTASFVVAFVAIGGFVAYMNMPNIELRVASAKAGFHAQLPDYKPTGYALEGGVKASKGVVSVNFRSGSSNFTLQQQPSTWDSRTLLDNVVAMNSESHKTYQSQGRTVYVYGNSAAWVNGGVLYSMQINGDMTHQEIVNVASSI